MSETLTVVELSGLVDVIFEVATQELYCDKETDILLLHDCLGSPRDIDKLHDQLNRIDRHRLAGSFLVNALVDKVMPGLWPAIIETAEWARDDMPNADGLRIRRIGEIRQGGIDPHVDDKIVGVTASIGVYGDADFYVERDPERDKFPEPRKISTDPTRLRSHVKQRPGDVVLFMNYPDTSCHAVQADSDRLGILVAANVVNKRNYRK